MWGLTITEDARRSASIRVPMASVVYWQSQEHSGHSLHAWQLGEVHVDLKTFGGLQHKARPLHTQTTRHQVSIAVYEKW